MAKKKQWWQYESSALGVFLMLAVTGAAYLALSISYQLDGYALWLSTAACGLIAGILFNVVARYRRTKKIHWIDFLLFDLLPW